MFKCAKKKELNIKRQYLYHEKIWFLSIYKKTVSLLIIEIIINIQLKKNWYILQDLKQFYYLEKNIEMW